jgi:Signal transduction histidine kinase
LFPLLSIPNRFKLYLLFLILLPALCACSRERRVRIGLSSDELERLAGNSLVLQRPRDPALVIGYSRNLATARRLVLVLLAGIVTLTLSLLALGYCVIRLRQINRLANVTIVTQRRFLTNLSKEFRTPLNGVVGMTGLLLNSGLGGEQRGYGETVQDCAHSLLHMLNNLLDYSRMEEGAIILESLDFDLHGVVEDVVEHYAAAARAEGLEISCVIAPNVAQIVVGDPVRLPPGAE